jgi:hypothetical protein
MDASTLVPGDPEPRRARRWRSTVAGAVAGGLCAASVAVPVTWALSPDDQPVSSTGTTADAGSTAPQTPMPPTPPGWAGGMALPPETADAQSRGVVLIDATLTNGEAAGTGLVLDESGLVLTNYHVVESARSWRGRRTCCGPRSRRTSRETAWRCAGPTPPATATGRR